MPCTIIAGLGAFLLLQVGASVHLLRALRAEDGVPSRPLAGALWIIGVGALPPLWQGLSTLAFTPAWQGARGGHWLYGLHDGNAGLVLVPFLIVAGVLAAEVVSGSTPGRCSAALPAALFTCAAICAWYVVAVLFMGAANERSWSGRLAFAAFPGVSGVNYALAAVLVRRRAVDRPAPHAFRAAWWGGLAAALVAKFVIARQQWLRLPVEEPEGCFVVGAAAHGHPALVRSWQHPQLGKPVTRQWHRFKALENALRARSPRCHALARRAYAVVGPPVAVSIRGRAWAADLVFLALRPFEPVAVVFTKALAPRR